MAPTFLVIIIMMASQFIAIQSESSEEIPNFNTTEKSSDDATTSLRAISIVWGTFGSEFIERVPGVEVKILTLYTSEMGAKSECRWTHQDRQKWAKKLDSIKLSVKNDTDTTNAYLGLEEFQGRNDLTPTAKWTLSILEDMENLTNSFVLGELLDFVILKYGAYLREKILMRQTQFPACRWTDEDRHRAGKMITRVIDQLATEAVNGVAGRLEDKPGDIFSEGDKQELKKEFDSLKKIFHTLFEPFEDN